jgi:hypothetical protein
VKEESEEGTDAPEADQPVPEEADDTMEVDKAEDVVKMEEE